MNDRRISTPCAIAAGLMALALTSMSATAMAKTIEIKNNLGQDLVFSQILNRQTVQIKSSPPATVAAGTTGTFEVKAGTALKVQHLKVEYFVGQAKASTTVNFGWLEKATEGVKCFTHSSSDAISGKSSKCASGTTTFSFSAQ
jgi:hypothetical protein